ncbi:hypothetical protein [Azospirillum doebereinerae]
MYILVRKEIDHRNLNQSYIDLKGPWGGYLSDGGWDKPFIEDENNWLDLSFLFPGGEAGSR